MLANLKTKSYNTTMQITKGFKYRLYLNKEQQKTTESLLLYIQSSL